MKVLMLGWEFPPYFAGGVGIVCYELTKEFSKHPSIDIEYVMAYGPDGEKRGNNLTISSAAALNEFEDKKNVSISKIPSLLHSYSTSESYDEIASAILERKKISTSQTLRTIKQIYGQNLMEEVYLYAQRVADKYRDGNFDIIHAHDWTTVPAALLLKQLTGKPVVFHVHITELDKTGGLGGDERIFEIERQAFEQADMLVPVSNFVKNRILNDYKIQPKNMSVIHNGGISDIKSQIATQKLPINAHPIILFAGRMTLQKGPEYFIHAAKKVLEYEPNARFIMAGTGDMLARMIELSAELGISKNVLFHGQYSREEADALFSIADVFVMPSVSEPFGIVPLEAISKGTPSIISKQSGISEVLENTFKVDFWDTDEIAHKIIAITRYECLRSHMSYLSHQEFKNFCWSKPAQKFKNLYEEIIN